MRKKFEFHELRVLSDPQYRCWRALVLHMSWNSISAQNALGNHFKLAFENAPKSLKSNKFNLKTLFFEVFWRPLARGWRRRPLPTLKVHNRGGTTKKSCLNSEKM